MSLDYTHRAHVLLRRWRRVFSLFVAKCANVPLPRSPTRLGPYQSEARFRMNRMADGPREPRVPRQLLNRPAMSEAIRAFAAGQITRTEMMARITL